MGRFSSSKLYLSCSTSGPSATEKPMPTKISMMRSSVDESGCSQPIGTGSPGNRNIQRFPSLRRSSSSRAASSRSARRSNLDLAAQRIDLLSDNGALFGAQLLPMPLSSAVNSPLRPSTDTRSSSMCGLRRLSSRWRTAWRMSLKFVLHDVSSLTVKKSAKYLGVKRLRIPLGRRAS